MKLQTTPFQLTTPGKSPYFLHWLAYVSEYFLGLKKLDAYYRQRRNNMSSREFLRFSLEKLGINYTMASGDGKDIPQQGPVIVVANHPYGAIEAFMLADLLLQQRSDVKVLTKEYLHSIDELSELFIGINLVEKGSSNNSNIQGINEAVKHLNNNGLLLVFPAGKVSTFQFNNRKIHDHKWNSIIAMLARKTSASTTPIYIEGHNSNWFHLASLLHPLLSTLLLPREVLNKRQQLIKLHIGETIACSELKTLPSDEAITDYLRLNTYLLNNQVKNKNDINVKNKRSMQTIALPVDKQKLQDDINTLTDDTLLLSKGIFSVYCAKAEQLPNVLQEIGRLREITFRQVAEGTGFSTDLDNYDEQYLHMFIWNGEQQEIVGAYRLGLVDKIMARSGINALYSRSLFRYRSKFIKDMGVPIEMGRSFIRPEFQRSLGALLLLWKGIATFAAHNPKYTTLFGPVSISSGYSELSRNLMMHFLQLHHYDHKRAKMVKATHPQKELSSIFWTKRMLMALKDNLLISKLVYRMEGDKGLPIILKQYLGLNGKLVSFNLDKEFNNTLDGMIIVDLLQVPEKILAKYMGKENAKNYLNR